MAKVSKKEHKKLIKKYKKLKRNSVEHETFDIEQSIAELNLSVAEITAHNLFETAMWALLKFDTKENSKTTKFIDCLYKKLIENREEFGEKYDFKSQENNYLQVFNVNCETYGIENLIQLKLNPDEEMQGMFDDGHYPEMIWLTSLFAEDAQSKVNAELEPNNLAMLLLGNEEPTAKLEE